MTKDDIIEMARQAGFVEYELDDGTTNAFDKRYERFANLVAAAEREGCAEIAEQGFKYALDGYQIADKIRARGNT
jgi:hypothetical protein